MIAGCGAGNIAAAVADVEHAICDVANCTWTMVPEMVPPTDDDDCVDGAVAGVDGGWRMKMSSILRCSVSNAWNAANCCLSKRANRVGLANSHATK